MHPNHTLHKLLRVIFPEILMEHFEISVGMTTPSKSKSGLMKRCYLESSDYKSGA